MDEIPLGDVYRLIEPGPVVLLDTAAAGRPNVMAMSWHMMVEFVPPTIACVVSRADFSQQALRETGECVIAIPSVEIAGKVVAAGNCSGLTTDKFADLGLTALPASEVAAPLVAECFANLECRVVDTRLVADYDLFVLEVVRAWRDPSKKRPRTMHHCGHGRFVVDGRTIELPSRMP